MNNKNNKYIFLAVLAIAPAFAFADTNLIAKGLGEDLHTSVSNTVNVGANANAKVELGDDDELDLDVEAESKTGMHDEESTSSEKNEHESENEGDEHAKMFIESAMQVENEDDLKVFTEGVVSTSDRIEDAKVDDIEGETHISVEGLHHGRFLGLFKINFKSTTSVDAGADNVIKVSSKPAWWSFMVFGSDYNKSKIESDLKENTHVKSHTSADINASAKIRAEILAAIAAELVATNN